MVARQMKMIFPSATCALLIACSQALGGIGESGAEPVTGQTDFNPQRFEFAIESGYLFGVINPPRDYQIGTEFITGRVRWGVMRSDNWLRGYNQFYISAVAEPFFRESRTVISDSTSVPDTTSFNPAGG